MIVNVISLVIQNIISKNQSLKGCPKKILRENIIIEGISADNRKEEMKGIRKK